MIATDLPEVLPNILKNAQTNKCEIECRSLNWFDPTDIECVLIIMADVVWVAPLIRPLAKTLQLLIKAHSFALMCYKLRSNVVHEEFIIIMQEHGLQLQIIEIIEGFEIYKIYKT